MSKFSREDIDRIFQQKFAELNHLEITIKPEFTVIIDTCFKFLIHKGIIPKPYSYVVQFVDLLTKGIVRSAISKGFGSACGLALTFDTYKATQAAMEAVQKWLDQTNEQDADRIGYVIDEYIRYYSFYFAENYHMEDPSALKQFEPDLQFRKYKK